MTLYSAPKLLICNFGCYGIAFWYRSSIILVSLQRYSVIAPASFWSCPIVIPAQAGIHVGILMIGVVLWMLNQVQHDSIML